MTAHASVHQVRRVGLFDKWTDVDVFTLAFEIGGKRAKTLRAPDWSYPPANSRQKVGDLFEVRVGSVVPYRHEHLGAWFPYTDAEVLPAWAEVIGLPQYIRTKTRTFLPPFVLVRRTSRPNDRIRCVGTVVRGDRPVAVENHLLVALPKDKTLRACYNLLQVLRDPASSRWLNQRICCRHLTVSALADLPWRDEP
jgi:hypothetical protein